MTSRIKIVCMAMVIISMIFPLKVFSGAVPKEGDKWPAFRFPALESKKDNAYLGITSADGFSLGDIGGRLAMVEIGGVYCPQCHKQAPSFNKLFFRIKKDPALADAVKMMFVAVGATQMEAMAMRKQYRLPFPVVLDPKFELHKLLGEPRTPFTMLVKKDGAIAFTHLGIIKDTDGFLEKIKTLSGQ